MGALPHNLRNRSRLAAADHTKGHLAPPRFSPARAHAIVMRMPYLRSISGLTPAAPESRPLTILRAEEGEQFFGTLSPEERAWLTAQGASRKAGALWILPGKKGIERAIYLAKSFDNSFAFGELADRLPKGNYHLTGDLSSAEKESVCLGFGLGAYCFDRYKKTPKERARLVWPTGIDRALVERRLEAFYLVRDLINTPARDMDPSHLEDAAREVAKKHGAKISVLRGAALLAKKYEMIHAVGQASSVEPRLIDLRWGKTSHPRLTLVGKGVCFDTGGLDLKPAQYMKLMKKDMGGAALVLGLSHLIMALELPVSLRVLIPAVENSVSGNAFHPLDVLRSKKGLTVEVGDTDAEGRLILADPLSDAAEEEPDLLIDAATLTGAARVALGTQMPAIFANRDESWLALEAAARETQDYLWRLPLHEPYRKKLESKVADLSNIGDSYAGAITAALFLQEFAKPARDWVHIDTMGYNLEGSPGRPVGGEALGLLALERWLARRYPAPARKAGKAKSSPAQNAKNGAKTAIPMGKRARG